MNSKLRKPFSFDGDNYDSEAKNDDEESKEFADLIASPQFGAKNTDRKSCLGF